MSKDEKKPDDDLVVGFDMGSEPAKATAVVLDSKGMVIHHSPIEPPKIPANPIIGPPLERPRRCGDCTACCKVLEVSALDKPADQWCVHRKVREGCVVHDFKPQECTAYECMWTLGVVRPAWARPDRIRVVFDMALTRWGWIIRAWETSAGGLGKRETRVVLDQLAKQAPVVTHFADGKWFVTFAGVAAKNGWTLHDVKQKRREFEAALADGTAWEPPQVVTPE